MFFSALSECNGICVLSYFLFVEFVVAQFGSVGSSRGISVAGKVVGFTVGRKRGCPGAHVC